MTDEEKAENYTKGLCKTCTFDTCRHNVLQTCAIRESLKQAHLAGLKAGRLKWHKVAYGDYPPCERGNYSINVMIDCGDIAYYNYEDECWVVEPIKKEWG